MPFIATAISSTLPLCPRAPLTLLVHRRCIPRLDVFIYCLSNYYLICSDPLLPSSCARRPGRPAGGVPWAAHSVLTMSDLPPRSLRPSDRPPPGRLALSSGPGQTGLSRQGSLASVPGFLKFPAGGTARSVGKSFQLFVHQTAPLPPVRVGAVDAPERRHAKPDLICPGALPELRK